MSAWQSAINKGIDKTVDKAIHHGRVLEREKIAGELEAMVESMTDNNFHTTAEMVGDWAQLIREGRPPKFDI